MSTAFSCLLSLPVSLSLFCERMLDRKRCRVYGSFGGLILWSIDRDVLTTKNKYREAVATLVKEWYSRTATCEVKKNNS